MCILDAETLFDLPTAELAHLFRLLAEAQVREDGLAEFWRLSPKALAIVFRAIGEGWRVPLPGIDPGHRERRLLNTPPPEPTSDSVRLPVCLAAIPR